MTQHDEEAVAEAPPRQASLAVWDVPSPAIAGERFAVKVGVKSETGCALSGCGVELRDAAGAIVASGLLGASPWTGTDALYWVALDLPAPANDGVAEFTVRFAPDGLDPPHAAASSRFSVAVVGRPEHRLSIRIVDKDTAAPLDGVEIRLGRYRARTGDSGAADIPVAKGAYRLEVWRAGYEADATPLDIARDFAIEVAMTAVAEDNPDARWTA